MRYENKTSYPTVEEFENSPEFYEYVQKQIPDWQKDYDLETQKLKKKAGLATQPTRRRRSRSSNSRRR